MKLPITILAFSLALALPSATATPFSDAIAELDEFGRTLASNKCPRPEKISIEYVTNKYEGSKDEIQTFQCSGYRIVVYEAHASNIVSELPLSLTLRRNIHGLPQNLGIGTPLHTVRSLLGPPYSSTRKELVYSSSDERPGQDIIIFHFNKQRVVRITWGWEID
ncbi:MAG: hypothetical protein AB1400_11545 [Pseudomonadota bacterium]